MTYKQIEGSREVRLWITQGVPAIASAALALYSIPETRKAIKNVGKKIKNVFSKKEGSEKDKSNVKVFIRKDAKAIIEKYAREKNN